MYSKCVQLQKYTGGGAEELVPPAPPPLDRTLLLYFSLYIFFYLGEAARVPLLNLQERVSLSLWASLALEECT